MRTEQTDAALQTLTAEIAAVREHFWLCHGCSLSALYGDDGEMQCGSCRTDFKRLPMDDLLSFMKVRWTKAESQTGGRMKT